MTSASGTSLGVLYGMTTVAVATIDLAKLSSLNGKLEKEDRRLNEKGTTDNLIVLFRKRREGFD